MMILWKSKLQYKWIQIYGFMFPVTYQASELRKKQKKKIVNFVIRSGLDMFGVQLICFPSLFFVECLK